MKLGFLNACLMDWTPERVIRFAYDEGFDAVEFHGGPGYSPVSWKAVAEGIEDPISAALKQYGLSIPAIMYGALPYLDPDPTQQEYAVNYVMTLIRAAHRLHIPVVSTFAGRRLGMTWNENIALFAQVFEPIAQLAETLDIRIAFENCPMTHGFSPATNIAYAPAVWDAMFAAVPSKALGLNLDPSHLVWLGIDPADAARHYSDRIFHCHAKDAEILSERLAQESILGETWWRYRLPGYGQIDWQRFLGTLMDVGYDGTISIEHEDPVWSGSEDKVIDGLLRTRDYLRSLL